MSRPRRGSFVNAAELHRQAQLREQLEEQQVWRLPESLSWSQEDWSQQERVARQRFQDQQMLPPRLPVQRDALRATLHQAALKQKRASCLNTPMHSSPGGVAAHQRPQRPSTSPQSSFSIPPRAVGAATSGATAISTSHTSQRDQPSRCKPPSVIVRDAGAELAMLLDAENEASQQESAEREEQREAQREAEREAQCEAERSRQKQTEQDQRAQEEAEQEQRAHEEAARQRIVAEEEAQRVRAAAEAEERRREEEYLEAGCKETIHGEIRGDVVEEGAGVCDLAAAAVAASEVDAMRATLAEGVPTVEEVLATPSPRVIPAIDSQAGHVPSTSLMNEAGATLGARLAHEEASEKVPTATTPSPDASLSNSPSTCASTVVGTVEAQPVHPAAAAAAAIEAEAPAAAVAEAAPTENDDDVTEPPDDDGGSQPACAPPPAPEQLPPPEQPPTAGCLVLEDGMPGCPPDCTRGHAHLPRTIFLPHEDSEPLTLGRGDACGIRLDSPKFLTMVSRVHCRFTCKRAASDEVEPAWHLEDLGSTNGTAVNGARLRREKRVRVSSGDLVVFGSRLSSEARYRLTLDLPANPPAARQAAEQAPALGPETGV